MIYFDHNATTPILPEVKQVMDLAMDEFWGNPSSSHSVGRTAFGQLEKAREKLANILGASPKEIFFTSGGTEADNIAIIGTMGLYPKSEILVSAIEHPAVYNAAHKLPTSDYHVLDIPVDENAIILLDEMKKNITDKTKCVSVMMANNETGTVQPIQEIKSLFNKKSQIIFHSDAVQAFGKIPINIVNLNVDMLSISSHKIYGPKGCGALFIKNGTKISPRTFGGSQERTIRTGTENIPAILGFIKAAEIAYQNIATESVRLFELTEFMFQEISAKIPRVLRNGHAKNRIPGTLNMCFPGAKTETVLALLDQQEICASGGSACSSGSISASRTLLAIGREKTDALCAIRFSLGRTNTKQEVIKVVEALTNIIFRLRK